MSTPFIDIYTRFNDNFSEQDLEKIEISQRKKFIRTAITSFIANVKRIDIDYDNMEVKDDFNEIELSLMGLYMYDAYLNQELFRYNKLVSISSDLVRITGVQDRVKNLKEMIVDNNAKINNLLTSLLL